MRCEFNAEGIGSDALRVLLPRSSNDFLLPRDTIRIMPGAIYIAELPFGNS